MHTYESFTLYNFFIIWFVRNYTFDDGSCWRFYSYDSREWSLNESYIWWMSFIFCCKMTNGNYVNISWWVMLSLILKEKWRRHKRMKWMTVSEINIHCVWLMNKCYKLWRRYQMVYELCDIKSINVTLWIQDCPKERSRFRAWHFIFPIMWWWDLQCMY